MVRIQDSQSWHRGSIPLSTTFPPFYRIFASMKKILTLHILLALAALPSRAQRHEIYSQRIATLQVVAGTDWQALPITLLNGQPIHIDFDDMTHDYHRYTYRIEHCDADWKVSQGLFESDYLKGWNHEQAIDNIEQSLNTNHLYTHYRLTIPNENCHITMSGNYKLTIYDDNAETNNQEDEANDKDGRKILTACFMVVEPQVQVAIGYSSNTDIDINKQHQQVSMNVNYGNLRVTNPSQQIKTVVLQNGRWNQAVWNAQPDYISADGLQWQHNRHLIFDAGNEYRKFELLDMDHPTMGIDETKWDGEEYQIYVMPDTPRPNYVHDESAKGSFYVRNSDNEDNHFTCEYAPVHFRLQTNRQPGDVYLNADWTYDRFLPTYRMEYNEADHSYHATVLLKQGYYSYQYLVLKSDGSTQPVSTEGNFFQTTNRYDALIYYRGTGDRTDRLVGWKSSQ